MSGGASLCCPMTFFLIRACAAAWPLPPRAAPSKGVRPPPVHRRGRPAAQPRQAAWLSTMAGHVGGGTRTTVTLLQRATAQTAARPAPRHAFELRRHGQRGPNSLPHHPPGLLLLRKGVLPIPRTAGDLSQCHFAVSPAARPASAHTELHPPGHEAAFRERSPWGIHIGQEEPVEPLHDIHLGRIVKIADGLADGAGGVLSAARGVRSKVAEPGMAGP